MIRYTAEYEGFILTIEEREDTLGNSLGFKGHCKEIDYHCRFSTDFMVLVSNFRKAVDEYESKRLDEVERNNPEFQAELEEALKDAIRYIKNNPESKLEYTGKEDIRAWLESLIDEEDE